MQLFLCYKFSHKHNINVIESRLFAKRYPLLGNNYRQSPRHNTEIKKNVVINDNIWRKTGINLLSDNTQKLWLDRMEFANSA